MAKSESDFLIPHDDEERPREDRSACETWLRWCRTENSLIRPADWAEVIAESKNALDRKWCCLETITSPCSLRLGPVKNFVVLVRSFVEDRVIIQ